MTLDVSRLTPADAVAALRSFPRRFTAVVALADEDDEGVLQRPGPDGRSVADHVDLAGRDLALLAGAVRQALEHERPVLHPAVLDPSTREQGGDRDRTVQASLDLLVLEAGALADRVEHVGADEWARAVQVAGRGDVAALDVLREAVRTTSDHLHAAEAARRPN